MEMCKSKILTCTPDIHANVNLLTHCTVTLRANDEIIFWSSQSARDLEVYFLPLPAKLAASHAFRYSTKKNNVMLPTNKSLGLDNNIVPYNRATCSVTAPAASELEQKL